jgi:hypothetical protein
LGEAIPTRIPTTSSTTTAAAAAVGPAPAVVVERRPFSEPPQGVRDSRLHGGVERQQYVDDARELPRQLVERRAYRAEAEQPAHTTSLGTLPTVEIRQFVEDGEAARLPVVERRQYVPEAAPRPPLPGSTREAAVSTHVRVRVPVHVPPPAASVSATTAVVERQQYISADRQEFAHSLPTPSTSTAIERHKYVEPARDSQQQSHTPKSTSANPALPSSDTSSAVAPASTATIAIAAETAATVKTAAAAAKAAKAAKAVASYSIFNEDVRESSGLSERDDQSHLDVNGRGGISSSSAPGGGRGESRIQGSEDIGGDDPRGSRDRDALQHKVRSGGRSSNITGDNVGNDNDSFGGKAGTLKSTVGSAMSPSKDSAKRSGAGTQSRRDLELKELEEQAERIRVSISFLFLFPPVHRISLLFARLNGHH